MFCIVTLIMSLGIIRKDFPRLEKGQRLFGILSVDYRGRAKEIIWHPFSGLQGVVSCGLFRDHLTVLGLCTFDGSWHGEIIL